MANVEVLQKVRSELKCSSSMINWIWSPRQDDIVTNTINEGEKPRASRLCWANIKDFPEWFIACDFDAQYLLITHTGIGESYAFFDPSVEELCSGEDIMTVSWGRCP